MLWVGWVRGGVGTQRGAGGTFAHNDKDFGNPYYRPELPSGTAGERRRERGREREDRKIEREDRECEKEGDREITRQRERQREGYVGGVGT